MRKFSIVSVLLAILLLSGCGAHSAYTADEDGSLNTGGTTLSTAAQSTDLIDKKLTEALAAIESAATEAIRQIQQAASTTKTTLPITETTTTIPSAGSLEPKTISVNIETKRGDGTLTFIKAESKPFANEIIFYYETSDESAKMPDISKTFLVGKSGKKYTTDTFYGVGNKGQVHFQGITDFSDLSTVTLTYAFEGYDPVTVTFDIPGL